MTKRKRYTSEFVRRVEIVQWIDFPTIGGLEAIREELTLAELAKKYDIHPTMISGWKRAAIENMASAFGGRATAEPADLREGRGKAACQDRPACGGTGFFGRCLQSHPRHWRQKAVKQGSSRSQRSAAVCAAVPDPLRPLLPPAWRKRGEPGPHGDHRPAVPGNAVVRLAANGPSFATRRARMRSRHRCVPLARRATADEADAPGPDLPRAQDQQEAP